MDAFEIPTDYCLIVRAFRQTNSLREASVVLGCDPASLVRKVQRISNDHGLLQKIRGRWILTEAGQRAVQWLEDSIKLQKILVNEKPRQRILTTMWISEQVVVPNIERLHIRTENKFIWQIRTSTPDFESDLLNGSSDYVISCHPPRDPAIAHRKVLPEKWIVVVPPSWRGSITGLSHERLTGYLKSKKFIRHANINPRSAVDFDADDSSDFYSDNLIGVRAAVEAGLGWSCVPEILVGFSLKRNLIVKVDLPVKIKGDLCIWWLRARKENGKHAKPIASWLSEIV